jgi:hypothetical protein
MFFVCFNLYLCFLCNVLYVFFSMICLIFLVARYLKVLCIFVNRCLIAFSMSIISSLI